MPHCNVGVLYCVLSSTCACVTGGHPGRSELAGAQRELPAAGVCHQPRGEAASVRDVAARGHRHTRHHQALHLQPRTPHQVGPHHREGQL